MDLTTIIEAQWRIYPAAALALYGLVLLADGLWFGFQGSRGLLRERDALVAQQKSASQSYEKRHLALAGH